MCACVVRGELCNLLTVFVSTGTLGRPSAILLCACVVRGEVCYRLTVFVSKGTRGRPSAILLCACVVRGEVCYLLTVFVSKGTRLKNLHSNFRQRDTIENLRPIFEIIAVIFYYNEL